MVARLMAGRAAFRLGSQVMPVALLLVWGDTVFDGYAHAMGLSLWLVLLPAAAEKAALTVLPRTRVLTAALARLTVALAAAPAVLLTAALVVAVLLAPGGQTALYLAAAAWSGATGLLMALSGLHRLRGRPLLDARAFTAAAALVVVATVVTWLVGWGPSAHLLFLLGGALVLVAAMVAVLPAAWVPLRPLPGSSGRRPLLGSSGRRPVPDAAARRPLLGRFARRATLMGLPELADAAATSAVFAVLALTGRTSDSGPLYLALVLAAVTGALLTYLLRVYQPATSARLRGPAGGGGRAQAERLLRLALRLGLGFAVVLAGWLAVPSARTVLTVTDGTAAYLVLALLVAVEVVVFALVVYAAFLLENTNSRVLTATSSAALVGLVATVLAAVPLVPPLGAAGGLAALVLGLTVKAFVLRRLLLSQHHPLTTDP